MAVRGVLEGLWQRTLLDNFSEEDLVSYGILIGHEFFYFIPYLPFLLCDYIPALQKYRIQPDKPFTWAARWNCIKKLMITHFLIQFPMMVLFKPYILKLGLTAALPFPPAWEIVLSVVACFIIEDFYFYWIHRALHHPFWYKHIHKIHHEHAAPFGIAAEYAHPLETLLLGMGTVLGPLLTTRHLVTLYLWLATRLFQTVEAHAGYHFPWSPTRLIPFWGGAHFHDFHHETFVGNYSSSFTLWDWVFGTSRQYYARLERREKEKATKTVKAAKPAKQVKSA
eukprot:TRINITY_DN927_c0_g1_i2.p1 TRINITY_DN927_c0_g1~~TRINITY_DN927_c0_g1_i2.p1  ORF type:complete len:289 (-),score=66.66 TRINITY_DN927_c0_g1_i2:54-896(-)